MSSKYSVRVSRIIIKVRDSDSTIPVGGFVLQT